MKETVERFVEAYFPAVHEKAAHLAETSLSLTLAFDLIKLVSKHKKIEAKEALIELGIRAGNDMSKEQAQFAEDVVSLAEDLSDLLIDHVGAQAVVECVPQDLVNDDVIEYMQEKGHQTILAVVKSVYKPAAAKPAAKAKVSKPAVIKGRGRKK